MEGGRTRLGLPIANGERRYHMNGRRMTGWSVMGLALAAGMVAADGQHTTRTYFGRPGVPYGPVNRTENPWTARVLGFRCCKTPEEEYQQFLRRYQIASAQYQVRLNRLDWEAYNKAQSPSPMAAGCAGGRCNANPNYRPGGAAGRNAGCDSGACDSGSCSTGGCSLCKLFGKVCKHNAGPQYPVIPPQNAYPAMNREDATRYLEGMQYYPPYQLIRSPRDFYMFNERFGSGR